jgi:phosphonate transport system ATP-binding protein
LRAGEVIFDGPTRTLTAERLRALYGAQCDELFAPVDPDAAAERQVPLSLPALQAA